MLSIFTFWDLTALSALRDRNFDLESIKMVKKKSKANSGNPKKSVQIRLRYLKYGVKRKDKKKRYFRPLLKRLGGCACGI